jgi:hypothetical protein
LKKSIDEAEETELETLLSPINPTISKPDSWDRLLWEQMLKLASITPSHLICGRGHNTHGWRLQSFGAIAEPVVLNQKLKLVAVKIHSAV